MSLNPEEIIILDVELPKHDDYLTMEERMEDYRKYHAEPLPIAQWEKTKWISKIVE